MHYLGHKQKIWLQNVVFADDYKINDWFLELPLGLEDHNKLNDIILDGYYSTDDKKLLNWLRREYIKKFIYEE